MKRVLLSSIAKSLAGRIFVITVLNRGTGTRVDIALRLDRFLENGYSAGTLGVKIDDDEQSVSISSDGEPRPVGKLVITFKGGEEEQDLIVLKDCYLTLVGDLDLLEKALPLVGDALINRSEFEGDDDELDTIERCVPTLQEMLFKRC